MQRLALVALAAIFGESVLRKIADIRKFDELITSLSGFDGTASLSLTILAIGSETALVLGFARAVWIKRMDYRTALGGSGLLCVYIVFICLTWHRIELIGSCGCDDAVLLRAIDAMLERGAEVVFGFIPTVPAVAVLRDILLLCWLWFMFRVQGAQSGRLRLMPLTFRRTRR